MNDNLFASFLMGGYECADHINRLGDRVNLLFDTQHDLRVLEDYKLLSVTGIKTVREGICWSNVEKYPFVYDFSEVKKRILAAEETGIQQLWDICHFGFPDDMTPTHPKFAVRFASVCAAFARFYRQHSSKQLIVTPINEISFLSWHAGDVRGTTPFAINAGFDIKYHLCKAAIAGIKALKQEDMFCRILLVEPLIKVHAVEGEAYPLEVFGHNESQFQAMDIIGGRMCPELGGNESYLDILGFNYYYNNQWQHNGRRLDWPNDVEIREPFNNLLLTAWQRYRRPMIVSETGHFENGRAAWLQHLAPQCMQAINRGVDLQGVCLYPLIGRTDWDNLEHYHSSGLWDIDNPFKHRIPHLPLLEQIQETQKLFQTAVTLGI